MLTAERVAVRQIPVHAKRSVLIFVVGLIAVMGYATVISEKLSLITEPIMTRDAAIIAVMLSVAAIIVVTCKVKTEEVLSASTFKSGMSAVVCVLGVGGSARRS